MQENERADCRVLGLVAAILTVAAIAFVLILSPGTRAPVTDATLASMEALGLCDTGVEHASGAGIFDYQRYDVAVLLTGSVRSMAWPAALVRLVTQPFGLPFTTHALAAVYALTIALGAYLAVSSLARRSLTAAYLTLAVYPLVLLHPALTGYLNSLCQEGAAIAFLLLFLGCLVHALCRPRGSGIGAALAVIFLGAQVVNATAWCIAFVPAVLVAAGVCIWHSYPRTSSAALHLAGAALALVMSFATVCAGFSSDREVQSDAANYQAVFQGVLPYARDQEALLAELGLDETFLPDIGHSYYEADDAFVHNPRGEDTAFLQQLTLSARLRLAARHPELLSSMVEGRAAYLADAYSPYITLTDGNPLYGHAGIYIILEIMAGHGGMQTILTRALLAACASLLLLPVLPRRSGIRLLPACMLALCASLAAFVPAGLLLTGPSVLERAKPIALLVSWLLLFYAVCSGLIVCQRVFTWLADRNAVLAPVWVEAPSPVAAHRSGLQISCRALLAVTAAVWVVIACAELLPESHIGGVNNGDYGRMMEQINIDWLPEQAADYATQANVHVIENYAYREPFHPECLTPLDPTYSLIYPSMVARLWSAITGQPFSTQVLALVMLFVTMLCVLSILRDLYPMLGRLTLLPALCLTVMLLGENYVAWYNSLFGESSISTGLMITLAAGLHLAVLPRGGKGSWRWLLALGIGIRFMCCAKAQMALALPAGLVLMGVFAVYHRPRGALRCTAFAAAAVLMAGIVTWDTLGVYRKNAGINEKYTVWQSVFYGALMIADDPDAAMEELGIAPEMKADIGKHAYYADEDYVYPIQSDEAQKYFYDHVDTITMVKYYLLHPLDLLQMLDRAAQESVSLHNGFMTYTNETYVATNKPYRVTLWANLRTLTACSSFWQYVLVYGIIVILCLRSLFRKSTKPKHRLFLILVLALMCIGVFQFPLSVVGNGFAGNNRQLYAFMLCHDLLIITLLTFITHWLMGKAHPKETIQEGGNCLVTEKEPV